MSFKKNYLFLNTGKEINAQSSDSTTLKKDGLYLVISPVTAADAGEYVCLAKETDVEIIRRYSITVIGELYTCMHLCNTQQKA